MSRPMTKTRTWVSGQAGRGDCSAYSSYSIAVWLSVCGLADHVEHEVWLGKHRHVAAVALKGGCAHALGEEALQIGMNGLILFGNDVPARLRLPGSSPHFRLEQIGFRCALGCPNELLLLLRKVAAEILCAFRTQPDTSVDDFHVRKNVRLPCCCQQLTVRDDCCPVVAENARANGMPGGGRCPPGFPVLKHNSLPRRKISEQKEFESH